MDKEPKYFSVDEYIVIEKYRNILRKEINPYLNEIESIFEKISSQFQKERTDLDKRTVDYICRVTVLQVFGLPGYHQIRESILKISLDIKDDYYEYVQKDYWEGKPQNVAEMIFKAIFEMGSF